MKILKQAQNRMSSSAVVADELRENFATEMMRRGLATGHGDTLADLHREMWWQFDEIRKSDTEARERAELQRLREKYGNAI